MDTKIASPTADFKLQRDESLATAPCGCEIERLVTGVASLIADKRPATLRLAFCPLHAASPALYEALKALVGKALGPNPDWRYVRDTDYASLTIKDFAQACQALALVEQP